MTDVEFEALRPDDGIGISLDIDGDAKRAESEPSPQVTAAPQPTPPPTSASVVADMVKHQKKFREGLREPDMGRKLNTSDSSSSSTRETKRKRERYINLGLAIAFSLSALACWASVPAKWVRLRQLVPTPLLALLPTEDPNRLFPNTYESVGGIETVVGYLPLTMLVSAAIYFWTCVVPQCGPWWLPWNWHNETSYWQNYKLQQNPTFWIVFGWTQGVGTILAGILFQLQLQNMLIALAFLAAAQTFVMSFGEQDNTKSPLGNRNDRRAFWLAFILYVARAALLWYEYRQMDKATVEGNKVEFNFPAWVYGVGFVYMIWDLLLILIAGSRQFSCCSMDNYPRYAKWQRGLFATEVFLASVITIGGLRSMD